MASPKKNRYSEALVVSNTYRVKLSPATMKMQANRMSIDLRRIKNEYVIRVISKDRAIALGIGVINSYYEKLQSIVRDDIMRRFKTTKIPTPKDSVELMGSRRKAVSDWKAIVNDIQHV
jgi:hypothetical protein